MIQRRFGAFPLRLKRSCAILQDVVEFDDAVFDRTIKTLEAIFGVAEFSLQIKQPAVRGLALGCLPLDQRLQEIGNPVGGQDALLKVG